MVMKRWTMPMPPSSAMATARRASVTVSMFADTMGIARGTFRLSRLLVSQSRRERTSERRNANPRRDAVDDRVGEGTRGRNVRHEMLHLAELPVGAGQRSDHG